MALSFSFSGTKAAYVTNHTIDAVLGPNCPNADVYRTNIITRCNWQCEGLNESADRQIKASLLFAKTEQEWQLISRSDYSNSCKLDRSQDS